MMGLSRFFDAVLVASAVVAGAIFAAITLAVPVDSLARSLFAKSLFGITDMVEFGLMTAVLLAAPWALSTGSHVMVDLIVSATTDRTKQALQRLTSLIGLVVSLIILWYATEALASAFTSGRMVRRVLVYPQFWNFVPLSICFALMSCEFFRQLVAGQRKRQGLSI